MSAKSKFVIATTAILSFYSFCATPRYATGADQLPDLRRPATMTDGSPDAKTWDDAKRVLEKDFASRDWQMCATHFEQLAVLCVNDKYEAFDRGLAFCSEGVRCIDRAENRDDLADLRRDFVDLRRELLVVKKAAEQASKLKSVTDSAQSAATQAQEATNKANTAAEKAEKASLPADADNRNLLASIKKALQALSPPDADGRERLKKALSEIDTLEREPGKVTFVQFAEQSLKLHRLVYDFASLREGGPARTTVVAGPTLLTKAGVERFLQTLQLPERLAALQPPQEAPRAIPADQHQRHHELWQMLNSNCTWLVSLLTDLGPQATIPNERVAEAFERMNGILSAATQLESAQLVARIEIYKETGSHDPAQQKAVQRVLDSDLAHVSRQLQALQDLFQQNLASSEADIKRVQADTEQNRTGVKAALAATRQAEQRLTQGVTELAARLGQDHERTAEQLQALRKRLQDEIQVALAKPRALPPDQLQAMSQELVGKLLGELAGYGYTPPTGAAGAPAAPRVEPLAEQPDPIMAKELYAVGREAFFAPGRLKEAAEHFARAARLDPQNPVYRYYLGLALYQSGRVLEGTAQVQAGKKMEAQYGRSEVRGSLERIQGPTRAWLEDIRLRS